MKILLTNHHLFSYQGTENFTYVIADFLRRRGHEVTLYSAYFARLQEDFKRIGVRIVTDIETIKGEAFDIAHVHHQINLYEVRFYFPTLPIVLLCHGVNFLETPPSFDVNVTQFLAVSERAENNMLKAGVEKDKIRLFRNMIDEDEFYPIKPIHEFPKKALVVSNKIDLYTEEVIRNACQQFNIACTFVGERFKKVSYHEMAELINQYDLIFSLGRGVMEALFCGRIPIVLDFEGGDGMVTEKTIHEQVKSNFSGNLYNLRYSVDELVEVIKQYDATKIDSLREVALTLFSAERRIDDLIAIYEQCMGVKVQPLGQSEQKMLATLVATIKETRKYTLHFKWLSSQSRPTLFQRVFNFFA